MSQVLVNFRMDEEDKKGMEEVCKELGLSMTTAFTIFAKKNEAGKSGFLVESPMIRSILITNISHLRRVTSEIDSGKAKLTEYQLTED